MRPYYYSIDFGKNWEGPFSREEIDSLCRVGLIDARTMVKEEAANPPPPFTSPAFTAPAFRGGSVGSVPVNNAVQEDAYMVTKNGIPSGPYPASYIREMMHRGEVQPSDMAWKNGMPQWVPLAAVAALVPLAMQTDAMSGLSQVPSGGMHPGGDASLGAAPVGGAVSMGADVAPVAEHSGLGDIVGKLVNRGVREWRSQQSDAALNPPPHAEPEAVVAGYADTTDYADVADYDIPEPTELPDMEGAMEAVELPDAETGAGIFDFLSSFFE